MPLSLAKTPRDRRLWFMAVKDDTRVAKKRGRGSSWLPVITRYEAMHRKRDMLRKTLPDIAHEVFDGSFPAPSLRWIDDGRWKVINLPINVLRVHRVVGAKKMAKFETALRRNRKLPLSELPMFIKLDGKYFSIHNEAAVFAARRLRLVEVMCAVVIVDEHEVMSFMKALNERKRLARQQDFSRMKKAIPSADVPSDANGHWITISDPHSPLHGRHMFIDENGIIRGGHSLPGSAIGKHVDSWWKSSGKSEPALHKKMQESKTNYRHHIDSGYMTRGTGFAKQSDGDPKNGSIFVSNVNIGNPDDFSIMCSVSDRRWLMDRGGKFDPRTKSVIVNGKDLPGIISHFRNVTVTNTAIESYEKYDKAHAKVAQKVKDEMTNAPKEKESIEQVIKRKEDKDDTIATKQFKMPSGTKTDQMFGHDLQPHQKAGVQFLLRKKHAVLMHDVGLGKTIQAIIAAKSVLNAGGEPFLIVAPASRKYGWENEIKKFSDAKTVVLDADLSPKMKQQRWREAENEHPDFVIVNYSMLQSKVIANKLKKIAPNIIADESHNVKGESTAQSKNFDLWSNAKYMWMLTATPFPNSKPKEIWTTLKHLDPLDTQDWDWFASHYVKFGSQRDQAGKPVPIGLKNKDLLAAKLRTLVQVRNARSSDVKIELPDKRSVEVNIPMGRAQKRLYDNTRHEILSSLDRGTVAQGTLQKIQNLEKIAIDPAMYMDKDDENTPLSSKEKWVVDAVHEHLKFPENKGMLVFCYHKLPLKKIYNVLKEQGIPVAQVIGDTESRTREKIQNDFNKGNIKVVLATQAGEEGMNFQHGGYTVVHMDTPWVPKSIQQRDGRVNRMGQKNPYTQHFHLVHPDSIDEYKRDRVREKLAENDSILGSHEADDFDERDLKDPDDVLKMLREKNDKSGKTVKKSWQSIVKTAPWHISVMHDDQVRAAVGAYRALLYDGAHPDVAIRKLRDGLWHSPQGVPQAFFWLRDYLPDTAIKQHAAHMADAFLLWCIIVHLPVPDVDIAGVNARIRAAHAADVSVHTGKKLRGLPLLVQDSNTDGPRAAKWEDIRKSVKNGITVEFF